MKAWPTTTWNDFYAKFSKQLAGRQHRYQSHTRHRMVQLVALGSRSQLGSVAVRSLGLPDYCYHSSQQHLPVSAEPSLRRLPQLWLDRRAGWAVAEGKHLRTKQDPEDNEIQPNQEDDGGTEKGDRGAKCPGVVDVQAE